MALFDAISKIWRCEFCDTGFSNINVAIAHEKRCENAPNSAKPQSDNDSDS